ncbi:MAG: bacteriohemerythrin [Spirochaetales bacterium]
MKLVEWDEKLSVGFSAIDEQHKKLIDITNRLFEACVQGKEAANAEFKTIVKEAVAYVKTHFAYEEELLKKVQYPAYAAHKAEHEEFVKKILQEVRDFESGKPFVPNNFARYLRDWTLEHIAVSDKKYQPFLRT